MGWCVGRGAGVQTQRRFSWGRGRAEEKASSGSGGGSGGHRRRVARGVLTRTVSVGTLCTEQDKQTSDVCITSVFSSSAIPSVRAQK